MAGEKGIGWESRTIPVAVWMRMLFASLTKVSHWETEKADAGSESSNQVRRPALMSFCNVCHVFVVYRDDSFDVLFDAPICEGHRKVCCGNAPCGGCRFFCVAARPENAGKPYISGLPLHGGKTIPSSKIGVWFTLFRRTLCEWL